MTIFKELQEICKPDCILAKKPSAINIDLTGMGIPEVNAHDHVVGTYFFSTAHKMSLLEIVRTERTTPKVVKNLLLLSKRIRKTPAVVGNCAGFTVNRIYFLQSMVSSFLVGLGSDPYGVDTACEKFELKIGTFKLLDFVGLDIVVAVVEFLT